VSTHVDGAPPSVSPDPDDGEPDRQPGGLDDGSQWVRAEIQRRMAENRSTRGRHARRGAAGSADDPPEPGARDSPRREPPPATGPQVVTPHTASPRTVPSPSVPAQTVPLPPPGFVAAGDLPENYVPRHSVLTPGPAAEPAAPISGPIPIVRPVAGDPADGEPRRGPVGGPSLPPTGMPLPVRKKRNGPGTPLQGSGVPAGPWSRPGAPIVPSEPVQRLGAPPERLGGDDPLPLWGVPASPPRGFAPAPAEPDVPAGRTADHAGTADEVDLDPDEAVPTPVDAVDAVDAIETGDRTDDTALDDPEPDEPDAGRGDEPVAPAPAPEAVDDDPADATTTVLPVVDGPMVDGTVPPPARLVGITVQRPSAGARAVAPRPVTPRHIPVVGTAPPEPGSTRVRVVLSERKGVARPVRTIKEVQEGTAVGELLRRNLIRSQLKVTLRFGALAVLVLGALPALLVLLPAVGEADVLGLRVPWLVLGVLMYPFLVAVAWRYTRVADRVEQDFADHVQD
jgi:hypothetical protein